MREGVFVRSKTTFSFCPVVWVAGTAIIQTAGGLLRSSSSQFPINAHVAGLAANQLLPLTWTAVLVSIYAVELCNKDINYELSRFLS
jgi:hypothetical protein